MEARQTQQPPVNKPDHYDIPTMIVIYTLVTLLGVGMCFCLRKANRLVPNKYSFPLALRRNYNKKQDDESDEDLRQGLLNDYSDQEEEEDEEQRIGTYRGNQRRSLDRYHLEDDEEEENQGRELTDIQPSKYHQYSDEEDEFGALQEAPPMESESSVPSTTKKPVVFVVDDDDDDDDDDDENDNKDIKKST